MYETLTTEKNAKNETNANAVTNAAGENRLRYEKSPYLRQHALDPVRWRPWGEEAFRAARLEDKPVFLSIGYSTCHWCHVMGRETFRDASVAEILNRAFIAVKVDREERPDIDSVYMAACQAMTGSGGWPLTVLMTAEQEPFWAGTYLPPRTRDGQMGLTELLEETERIWQTDRAQLIDLGRRVTAHIALREEHAPEKPGRELLQKAARQYQEGFDPANGGLGGAPKFPMPHQLLFLMEYAARENSPEIMGMVETTLTQMSRGGIFDQIGGGFCRYSTDPSWRMPHFEKMLYDNALLAYTYLQAYAQTGKPWYREIACRTLEYALRELRLPAGGFACGQDADSGGKEGRYYLLAGREIRAVLGDETGARFCNWYGMEGAGEHLPHLLDNRQYELSGGRFVTEWEKLSDYRRRRRPLHRDNKVVTAWNAMMIAALSKAYRVLGEKRYLRAAESTRMFLRTRLSAPDGTLYLCWREGEAAVFGQLDDYAFYCWALLELYAANFSVSCLREAVKLADRMWDLFRDEKRQDDFCDFCGFYRTAHDGEKLIVRQKEPWDGAYPSGNGAAAMALGRLWRLTREDRFRVRQRVLLEWLAGELRDAPVAGCFSLLAMAEDLYPNRDLVCVSAGNTPAWLAGTAEEYRLSAVAKTPDNSKALERLAPYIKGYPVPAKGQMLYLCREGACLAPAENLEQLRRLVT